MLPGTRYRNLHSCPVMFFTKNFTMRRAHWQWVLTHQFKTVLQHSRVFCFFLFFSFLSFLCCCQEQLQGIKLPGLPATPKVRLIVVCLGFFVKILFITPTTHCQIVPFSSSLCECLPLEPGKHSGAFVESSGPFLRSEGTFDCRLLQFFFGCFWLKKHPELTQKLLFCCQSSFPPFTGSTGGPSVVDSIKKVIFKQKR